LRVAAALTNQVNLLKSFSSAETIWWKTIAFEDWGADNLFPDSLELLEIGRPSACMLGLIPRWKVLPGNDARSPNGTAQSDPAASFNGMMY